MILIIAVVVPLLAACDDDDDEETTTVTVTTTTTTTPSATTQPPATTTTSQPPAAGVTIESSIGEILDAPGGEALLRKCLGDEVVDNPQLSMAFGMNLPTIAPMSGGVITDEMVACVEEGL